MNVVDCIQGDPLWFAARCGCLTSSRIADALAVLKRGGESAARRNLRYDMAWERLTRKHIEHFVSKPMEWGTEHEPMGRAAYEIATGKDVNLVGFVMHPTILLAGASPDGLVGSDGLIEIKCPTARVHLEYLEGECVPAEYQPQILWQLAATGRQWCDFASYDPRMPEELQLFTCRLQRDNAKIAEMEAEAVKFLAEVEALIERLRGRLEGALRLSVARARAGLGELGITEQDAASVVG